MRSIYNSLLLVSLLGGVCFSSSCKREIIANPEQYSKVYMPQAVDKPKAVEFFMRDTMQSIVFGAAYGGVDDQPNNINVRFKAEPGLVAAFNTANGTNYLELPAGSYQIPETEAIITPGQLSTKPLKIKVKTIGAIAPLREYLLPVSIEQISSAIPINNNLRTAYFKVKGVYGEHVRTAWQVVSVSSQQPNSAKNAFDGNTATNWHTQWQGAQPPHPHTIVVDMMTSNTIQGFYFWPAPNTTTGNPVAGSIQVSADGTTWQTATTFSGLTNTLEKQSVYLTSPVQGRYLKIIITSSTGNTHFTHPSEIGTYF